MSKGFQEGKGEFSFANNDKYKGHYCAHVSGIAWRQGPGVYTTNDGQKYQGIWKDDKLNEAENVLIRYQNNANYEGRLQKYKYNGVGTYSFGNRSRLSCNFINNKPLGDVIYIDQQDCLWYGKAEDEKVVLTKEHVFSYELDSERGKGVPKHRPKVPVVATTESEEATVENSYDMKEMEKVIFAKSFQTPSHVDFEDSDWLRDHQKFLRTQKIILDKIKYRGASSLSEAEKMWYKEYYQSAKILQNRKQKNMKKIKNDLLRQHFEEEAKNTCPPTRVFYPQPYEEQALEG